MPKGDFLTFPREGGTVQVDKKTVTGRVSWARNLAEGQTYLVFGWHPKGELAIPLDALYQVVGPRLHSMATERSGRDAIETDTLDGVRERIGAHPKGKLWRRLATAAAWGAAIAIGTASLLSALLGRGRVSDVISPKAR